MRSTHAVTLDAVLLATMTLPAIGLTQSATLAGIRIDNPAPSEGAQFGFAVAGLHDVNGDGTGDLAVGAPGPFGLIPTCGIIDPNERCPEMGAFRVPGREGRY